MSLGERICENFKNGVGLETIQGPWLDEVPHDKADISPHALYFVIPQSGRVVTTFGVTTYQNCDIRIEVYDTVPGKEWEYAEYVEDAFDRRFPLDSGFHLGQWKQTAKYVRRAGRHNQKEVFVSVNAYRLTIERTPNTIQEINKWQPHLALTAA